MDKVKDAYAVHFDGNFRLTFNPIAIGFRLGYSQFRREEQWRDPKYQSLMGLATGSYLFSRNSAVSPFVRAGAGITFSNDRGGIFNDGFKTNFCFMPSVGVVFVRRIALSADDAFISKKYSHAAVSLGFRF